MALVRVEHLGFTYPEVPAPALVDVSLSLEIHPGELICLLGSSGSGKTTLLRSLAGLVPHFHGGRFAGRVEVAGLDTRRARPSDLAGTVASVFQDPEDQVVFTIVENEVTFGLENLGVEPNAIRGRVGETLRALGADHLAERRTHELSAGELQRVCVASALALRPQLLLLDEPTSQLDPEAAEALRGRGVAVEGLRGRARLLSPLVAGSLERSLNLAESMEARGFGRPGRTRAPSPAWSSLDRLVLVGAAILVLGGVLWL